MRMLATHYSSKAQPAIAKKNRAQVAHVLPPVNGLSLATQFSKSSTNEELHTATILSNFVVEDNCIKCRAGYRKLSQRGTAAVWNLIPWYGSPNAIAAASNHELWNAQDGALIKGGFTSDDWHWTAFSNLGQRDFTVMVNGSDGVWSWDGGLTSTNPAPVAVTNLSKANPAVCTVAAGSISQFTNGMVVTIAGAGPDTHMLAANGPQLIANVGAPANTFTLVGVDTSAAAAAQTTGVTADPPGTGIVKETVTGPPAEPWVVPDQFQIVLAHMNRLFFADNDNLAVYYLPLQQKSGEVRVLPLNAIFRRGGSIRAMFTWTVDGGAGIDDLLVVFSTNGECAIYKGTDPDTDFAMAGVFRFDSPMSKHSITQYGGELYVLISTGLVPLSTMLRAETEQLGESERSVTSLFLKASIAYRSTHGWQTFLNPSTGRMFCNVPLGAPNRYQQFIRHMPKAVWSTFDDIPARCWSWLDPVVYFGDDSGGVYEMHPRYLNDNGQPIRVDVQTAWDDFKAAGDKHFQAVKTYMSTNGNVHPFIDMKVDFDYSPAENLPDIGATTPGPEWDVVLWDQEYWGAGEKAVTIWNGVKPIGHIGAVRMTARTDNATLSISGWDVMFEQGAFGG